MKQSQVHLEFSLYVTDSEGEIVREDVNSRKYERSDASFVLQIESFLRDMLAVYRGKAETRLRLP